MEVGEEEGGGGGGGRMRGGGEVVSVQKKLEYFSTLRRVGGHGNIGSLMLELICNGSQVSL